MSEKQLTVAELLARAEKENPEGARRERRRRRSLEEGGVTVAELTDSFKKVEVKPTEVKHSAHPLDKPEEQAPAPSGRSVKIQRVEPVEEPAPKDEPATDTAFVEVVEKAPSTSETTKIPKVTTPPVSEPVPEAVPEFEQVRVDEPVEEPVTQVTEVTEVTEPADVAEVEQHEEPAQPVDEAEQVEEIEVEEATINPIVMVLLVFLGVLAGVLGFLAFQWLWANTSTIVAALLAAVAVAAVVFGVRAMRTGRDGLTMTLAGLAAAVMAFGPALI